MHTEKQNNFYTGNTITTLSCRRTYHRRTYNRSANSGKNQHSIIKHKNSRNQLIISSDIKKILKDNTIIMYKTIIKTTTNPRSNIHKKNINKIAFNTGTNTSNILITKNHYISKPNVFKQTSLTKLE